MGVARTVLACLATLATASASLAAATSFHHDSTFELSVSHHGQPADCSDLEIDAGRRPVETAEDHFTVPRAEAALRVAAAPRGGIVVSGWDGRDYDVVACKAVAGKDAALARASLGSVHVSLRGGAIETSGPAGDDWLVYLIIRAPRDATMDLAMENGPLSLRDTHGRFTVRGSNGPVSLENVAGEVTVEVENGPVSVVDGGGDVRVRTENGPIAVSLSGAEWDGEGLEARAVNGPLALDLADGYRGGVRVESSGNAPWSCADLCSEGERTWGNSGRQFEIGPRPARVRLSTVNGPVAIGEL